ncbi:MAG: hypothetical protein EPN89_17670 [Methylovulum sp.]|nr:MAG: hypothetical protein EPN89_17670 [Methylovulum sp.]
MKLANLISRVVILGLSVHGSGLAGENVWSTLGPTGLPGITEFAISTTSPTTVYLASRNGNVYQSTDGGETWKARSKGLVQTYGVYSLVVDPVQPATVYAGTSIGVKGGGLYKSTDAGKHWRRIESDLPTTPFGLKISALAIHPRNQNTLYAGYTNVFGESSPGLFKTIDGGLQWQTINHGLPKGIGITSLLFDPANPRRMYALLEKRGIYLTSDAGKSWQAINNGLTDLEINTLVANPNAPAMLFAGTAHNGVFKSSDRGKTWQPGGMQGIAVAALEIVFSTPETLYAGTASDGLFKSTDNGASWTSVQSSGLTETCFTEIRGQGSRLFTGGCNFGPFRSDNQGHSWKAATQGLPGYPVRNLGISSTRLYAGAIGGGVFRSADRGKNWTNVGLRNLFITGLVIDPRDSGRVYVGIDKNSHAISGGGPAVGAIYKTTSGGKHWRPINHGIPQKTVSHLAIDPVSPDTLYLSTGMWPGTPGAFKSIDVGEHWQPINHGLPENDYNGTIGIDVNTITVDSVHPNTLYAAVNAEGVFKSTDSGLNWTATGLMKGRYGCGYYCNIFALAVDPADSNTVYAGAEIGDGAFKSLDGGISWKAMNGLPLERVNAFAIDPTNPKRVFAATSAGVGMSVDGGESWLIINSGLPSLEVYSLALDSDDPKTLYAGTTKGLAFISFTDGFTSR